MVETEKPKMTGRVKFAVVLTGFFLILTVSHAQNILAKYEGEGFGWWLAWGLAISIDLAIAFSAYVMTSDTLVDWVRWVAGFWFVFLFAVALGLNTTYYLSHKNEFWSWVFGAALPISITVLGIIVPGLSLKKEEGQESEETQSQPVPSPQQPVPDYSQLLTAINEVLLRLQSRLDIMETRIEEARQRAQPVQAGAGLVVSSQGAADSGGDVEALQEAQELLLIGAETKPGPQSDIRAEIARLIDKGLNVPQIAERLGKSTRTIEYHKKILKDKGNSNGG